LRSPALGQRTHLEVLLPDGYESTTQRYPVLYLLGGHLGTYQQWPTKSDVVAFARRLPVIVVMPDSGNGWFVNPANGGGPRWEDYIIDELIPYVDTHYRTVANRTGRAVAGLSMGGLAAFDYAARHPDMFVAAASFSGSLNLIRMQNAGWFKAFPSLSVFGDTRTDALYWHGHNPIDLAPNLQGIRLYLASGNGQPGPLDGDRSWPDPGEVYSRVVLRDMVAALSRAGIRAAVEDYGPGTHTWPYWTRDLHHALPLMLDTFAHPPALPAPWSYRTIDDHFLVWGYHVIRSGAPPAWTTLRDVSHRGLTVAGTGHLTLVTAPLYRPDATYRVTIDAVQDEVTADDAGRLYLQLTLAGPEAPQHVTIAAIVP
jgi:S-formylglutathione hydrolase FrmB